MTPPFFSVIIPFYNAEKFLEESILSVVNQSVHAWELLLLDDGSTDNSFQIARNWTQKEQRINLLQHPGGKNKGVSASRNLGIKHAKGNWVAFLDADDVWLPDKLEKQYEIIRQFEAQELVFVYCPAKVIDETGKPIAAKSQAKRHNPMFGIYGSGRPGWQTDAFNWAINKGFEAPTSSVICRKDIIRQLGGFEEDMSYSEDGLMWYRMIEKGNMYFINTPLLLYRVHATQWNAGVTSQVKLARRFVGYSRLLEKTSEDHKKRVSFLLVSKGFRLVVRNNLGYPYLSFKFIGEHWKKLLYNPKVLFVHKLYSPLVFLMELLLAPFRLIRLTLK